MSDRRIARRRDRYEDKPETPFDQLSPRVRITLPAIKVGGGKLVAYHYFNGVLYANGRPIRWRDR